MNDRTSRAAPATPAKVKRTTKRKTAPRKAASPAAPAAEVAAASPLFAATIAVRWRDLDALNHVNNANYLTYLEEARLQWLATVPGPWFDAHAMPVMAASQLNYRRPIEWPAALRVELVAERVGTTSVTLAHRVLDAAQPDVLYCDGNVVLVWVDPASGKPVPLPAAIRTSIAAT